MLDEYAIGGTFGIIQSNGGLTQLERARSLPVNTLLSGPAAGVVGAVEVARLSGETNLLAFDVGGTSTDISLVENSDVRLSAEGGIGGYPVKVPQVRVHTIGAGGGSIARPVLGMLKVGPASAGADPGPVCYATGGNEPTGTDAAVVLGYIDPEYFLGGEIRLDGEAAERAIAENIARPLSLSRDEAALAILQVQAANIVTGIRQVSVEVGKDPREFTLLPFGGAGGIYAGLVAADAGMSRILIPKHPSVLSALGMLMTDIRYDRTLTSVMRAKDAEPSAMGELFAQMANHARDDFSREGGGNAELRFEFSCDMRYVGQAYEINVRLPFDAPGFTPDVDELCGRFHTEHLRLYGQSSQGEPVEIVNLRVGLIGEVAKATLEPLTSEVGSGPQPLGARRVLFALAQGWVDCPIYAREGLPVGAQLTGPAIIEERGASIPIRPGHALSVDGYGNLLIEVSAP